MLNTDDLRYYTGIGTGYSQSEMMRLAALEIDELRGELAVAREALMRAKRWGGMGKAWDSGVALDLVAWIDGGMTGPLPPMPEWLPAPRQASRDLGKRSK